MNRTWIVNLALAVAVFATYWPTLGHGFIDLDDPDYVYNNTNVKNGLTTDGAVWAFTTGHMSNWHPMTWLSLMFDAEVHRRFGRMLSVAFEPDANGLLPGAYHFTNVALHAVNVMLLFGLLRSMTGAFWRSALVAALLAVHPIHVESVAWVTERKDVLSMFFMLLTVRAYVNFVRDRDGRAYVLMLVFFALGLMSKPMIVTLPAVLLLLDVWPLRRMAIFGSEHDTSLTSCGSVTQTPNPHTSWQRLLLEKVPLLTMAAACSIVTQIVQEGAGYLQDGVWAPKGVRIANAIVSYVRYIGTMFWPADLAVLYPNPSHIGHASWTLSQTLAAVAVLIVITLFTFVLAWRSRERLYLPVGWLWFLGTMIPVIGLIQIGRHSMADRYAYIPFIGLYIMVAWGLAELTSRLKPGVPATIAMLLIAALAIIARMQTRHWATSAALFAHTLAVTKDNWFIHNNYASGLEGQGRVEEAVNEMLKAVEIYPEGAWLRHNLGTVYALKLKRYYDAQVQFEKAIELDPNYAKAHHNLAVVLSIRKLPARAVYHAEQAVRLMPDVVEFRTTLANLLVAENRIDDAIEQLEHVKTLESQRAADYDRLIEQLRAKRPANSPPPPR